MKSVFAMWWGIALVGMNSSLCKPVDNLLLPVSATLAKSVLYSQVLDRVFVWRHNLT